MRRIVRASQVVGAVLSVLVVGGILSCRPVHTIVTYDEWCTQLLGGELSGLAIRFDHRAIRADFARVLNESVVASAAKDHLGGAKRDDKVVRKLERLKMIGAWTQGDTLYIANELLIQDKELGIDQYQEMVTRFHKDFDSMGNAKGEKYSKWRHSITDDRYCMLATIGDHFAKCVLVGPEGRSVTIPLRFMWKKELADTGKTSTH